ncbi:MULTISPECIES: amidohydrolase family protein [Actinomadura]|uniref:Amidohydrolase family protein n=1 Tax=Actinomadura yumaensis TaxID=111807 RepID=A0ABW2CZW0_9ACTN|nr:amidohydrolase family protein [Actinomadura sp. J1-007]MWK34226.1 amidohydrolase family protein [Actinomadura sp. J1-007]
MTKPLLLERATIAGATPARPAAGTADATDVLLADGLVAAIGPDAAADPRTPSAERLDLDGYVLLPSAAEAHAHLDKALLARRVANPTGDLQGAVDAVRSVYDSMDEADVTSRAVKALSTALANGYTAVRSHADVQDELGTRSLRALLKLRERIAGLIDLQLVSLTGFPLAGAGRDGRHHRRLLTEAIDLGVDVVGGAPWLDPNPREAVAILVRAAAEAGLPTDLHLDETTDASMLMLRVYADEVARHGLGGRATASHCVSLGQQDPGTAREIARTLADVGISVVTLPQTNLYLQGRDDPTRTPRALTAVGTLREAGVTVAGGGDNWRDPFNPLGRIDPFETASLLVAAAHLAPADAYDAVTAKARAALGLPPVAVEPGSPADLLAVRAPSLDEAIAAAPQDRIVLRAGRVVARTRVVRETVPDLNAAPGHAPASNMETT